MTDWELGDLPERFASEDELEAFMTRPMPGLAADLAKAPGALTILGVGGKMGPSLAVMAKRADPARRVIGVARFSDAAARQKLDDAGVETITCDLLDKAAVAKLEVTPNVIFMAGMKFGASGNEPLTWAMNAHVPALIADHFITSRIVAFSTACVYPFVDIRHQGAREDVAPTPVGEYANSCVGRERMFQHFSGQHGTPGRLLRLSYAIDMRYGVLHDVAQSVLKGTEIPLVMGHANVIWQGDANAIALRALAHTTTPTTPLNLSGPEIVSIRAVANRFGQYFDRKPVFVGEEGPTSWLVNTDQQQKLFGYPQIPLARLIAWTADWVSRGQASLGKPTHFEVSDGKY
ncbi:NAD-dependent epimerase/dehydratase family protein [Devosia algicola]|uniref:NAD-dependent epimerase/dehydratase family protein n=1 Tax=Devosia algicola TaxID=3026418 RepID=A0ABY7YNX3_9HYPH|nr:NAD-dependent epimerase/dehydratase family protein [Devosia algicola]WDR02897.1 NAD-dependent epimerase/dehydratase family protein [Devosia algicola]